MPGDARGRSHCGEGCSAPPGCWVLAPPASPGYPGSGSSGPGAAGPALGARCRLKPGFAPPRAQRRLGRPRVLPRAFLPASVSPFASQKRWGGDGAVAGGEEAPWGPGCRAGVLSGGERWEGGARCRFAARGTGWGWGCGGCRGGRSEAPQSPPSSAYPHPSALSRASSSAMEQMAWGQCPSPPRPVPQFPQDMAIPFHDGVPLFFIPPKSCSGCGLSPRSALAPIPRVPGMGCVATRSHSRAGGDKRSVGDACPCSSRVHCQPAGSQK